jgi:hypothetical protein
MELVDAFRRESLDRLSFTFVSDLWENEKTEDDFYAWDQSWYLPPSSEGAPKRLSMAAGGRLKDFGWVEGAKP